MRSILRPLLILPLLFAVAIQAQELSVTATNPSSFARANEPVVVEWSAVAAKFPNAQRSSLRIVDEQRRMYVYQVDDLDFDGTPDELVFTADFAAKQARMFTVRDTVEQFSKTSSVILSTDAQNWKHVDGVLQSLDDDDGPGLRRDQTRYRFDGVGWESEIVGYRVYLDERNAVDIQAKRRHGLHWKFIGSTNVDYQQNGDWGMDPLHVGPALGVGGIAFWVGDSVHKPMTLDRRRCRIVARGPVRAVVRVEYFGWDLDGEKADVTSLFTICAGDRVTEHRVYLQKGAPKMLATGIVKHDSSTVMWDAQGAWLYSTGRQSRASDELFLGLNFAKSSVVKRTADRYNDLVLLKLDAQTPLKFLISSVWQGETGAMWSDRKLQSLLKQTAARLNEPLAIVAK